MEKSDRKVKIKRKFNFLGYSTFKTVSRRFHGKWKSGESLTIWDTLPSKRCPVCFMDKKWSENEHQAKLGQMLSEKCEKIQQKHNKCCQNVKNAVKIMSDTSNFHQHSVAYMKMSSKWCRIHGSSRPRKPPVAEMHIFATFFEVQLEGHGADKRGKDWTAERWGWKSWPKQAQI